MVKQMLAYSFIGSPKKIAPTLQYFLAQTRVDEVMAVSHIYDQDARLRSYQIFVGVMKNIHQYFRQCKIRKAVPLLIAGNLPVHY